MAPVGSYESLMAAIQGGADSVYFGIEGLNMRSRSSNNFTTEDLRKIAKICEEHGLKSYLTVNTVIYDEDLPLMRTIIDAAKEAKGRPTMIVAKTVKGKGVSFMENNVKFHGSTPTAEQFEQAFKELDAQIASLEV